MANKEIHELITAEELSSSDVIAEQREDSGTWLTRKLTFNSLGLFLNKVLAYASDLLTTNKTIIGAINELYQTSSTPWVDESGTLTAGATSITLTNNAITANATIDVYTDDAFVGVVPSSVVRDAINHTVTLTFEAQSSNMPVKVRIT